MCKSQLRGEQQQQAFEIAFRLRYQLFLPKTYDDGSTGKKWPMILFLHGMGERGDDVELVKTHGIPKIVEHRAELPFITVSPQCPDGTLWRDHHITLKALLDNLITRYRVDLSRVYLTGLSMGGYGTWSLAMAYPDTFAAIAPICGGGSTDWIFNLQNVPVWAFHGADDPIVPVERSKQMVDALKAHGGSVKLTVYPGVEHDSWTQTYENPGLYEWFLQHTR